LLCPFPKGLAVNIFDAGDVGIESPVLARLIGKGRTLYGPNRVPSAVRRSHNQKVAGQRQAFVAHRFSFCLLVTVQIDNNQGRERGDQKGAIKKAEGERKQIV
jgi:hypothetical protein